MAREQIPQDQELPREERLREYLDGYLSVSEKTNAERVAEAEERGREAERRAEQRRKADDFLERERVEELKRIKREIAREPGKTKDKAQNPARKAVDITTPDIVGTVATPANENSDSTPTKEIVRTKAPTNKWAAGFLAAMSIFGGKGGVEANAQTTPHGADASSQNTSPSTDNETVHPGRDTAVNADFSVGETTPAKAETPTTAEASSDQQEDGAPEIIGTYTVEDGDGFYISAKRALRNALEKSGSKKEKILQSIRDKYPNLANITDEKELTEQWAMEEGKIYGIVMQKGGGYKYKLTIFENDVVQVATDADGYPYTTVLGGHMGEEKIHPASIEEKIETKTATTSFDVHDGDRKRTFSKGDTVTYTTAKGKAADYIVEGPSEDGGLILKEIDSNKQFAISYKGLERVAKQKKLSKDEEPKGRIFTPPVNPALPDTPEYFLNPSLNATPEAPAKPPARKDESGLKPIDVGRPPTIKTYPVNSAFSKSETRVRKEPNSVEEALLGNGTVPENDPARARAMIAWHELDMTLDRVLPDRTAYAEVQKEMLELTTQFLEKDESTQLLTLERIFKTLEQKANAVETAQRAARPRVSLLQRFFDGRRKRDSRAEEYRKVVNSITKEIRIAVDHLDITPPNPDSDVAKTGQ